MPSVREVCCLPCAVLGKQLLGLHPCANTVHDLCRVLQVSLPGHICAVIVTTLVLEGWSSTLDPVHSIMDDVETAINASAGWSQQAKFMLKSCGQELKAQLC